MVADGASAGLGGVRWREVGHGPSRLLARVATTRWLADVVTVGFAAAFSLALTCAGPVELVISPLRWWVDLVSGLVSAVALLGRRRALLPLVFAVLVLGCFSTSVAPASAVLLFHVGLHCRERTAILIGLVNILVSVVLYELRMEHLGPWPVVRTAVVAGVIGFTLVALGATIRVRGQLLETLRARADNADRRARETERRRIAREMHDVLAHQIAVLTMQAGSLTRRTRLTESELRGGVDEIAASARHALDDLNEILKVLRAPSEDHGLDEPIDLLPGHRPQPVLSDLPSLIERFRAAGTPVDAQFDLADPDALPDRLGRTVYRLTQEALANAAKHAPGAAVRLELLDSSPDHLRLSVTNDVRVRSRSDPIPATTASSGSGTGLVGLRERVELAGGTVHTCGLGTVNDQWVFRLDVTLPRRGGGHVASGPDTAQSARRTPRPA